MTGDLHLISGGPKIILQDNTDDDDQQIVFRNNERLMNILGTADFTGGGGGDGFYIGSTTSDGEIGLVTANTTALTPDTSQNATFAESVTITGDLDVQGSGITLVDSIVFSGVEYRVLIQLVPQLMQRQRYVDAVTTVGLTLHN